MICLNETLVFALWVFGVPVLHVILIFVYHEGRRDQMRSADDPPAGIT